MLTVKPPEETGKKTGNGFALPFGPFGMSTALMIFTSLGGVVGHIYIGL